MSAAIEFIRETGSTNADLLKRIQAGEPVPEGNWLVTDRQRQGRGRQGRQWLDGPGNFLGSTVVRLMAGDPPVASLSLMAGVAVHAAVGSGGVHLDQLQLKWPNDLLLNGAKVAGILLERSGNHVVIGIGVNLAAAPSFEDRMTGSLASAGLALPRDQFARVLADRFAFELAQWRQSGMVALINRWLGAAHRIGSPLSVHSPQGVRLHGSFDGLEPDGALRLRLADGAVRVIYAGDVALERN